MRKLVRKFFLWGFFRYCRDSEWEIYKHNLGHFLQEVKSQHIRDILTRIPKEELIKAVNESKDYSTLIDLITKCYNKNQYYEV